MVLHKKNTIPERRTQPWKFKKAFDVDNVNDSNGEEMVVQTTPKNKTPKGRKSQSMSEKKVNYDLPGEKTPQKDNSFIAKNEQRIPVDYRKTRVQEFKVMKGNKSIQKKKSQDEEMSDDDDDDDDMDDEVDNDNVVLDWHDNYKDDDDEDEDDDDDDEDDDDDDDDEDDDNKEEDEEKEQKNVNTSIKVADKSEKPQTSKANIPKNEILEKEISEILEETAQRRERDIKTLFVGNLPANTTPNELKALSSDITEVIPRTKSYCFIRFASEEKADSNYKALKGKQLKGQLLNIDYMGEKSKSIQKKETKGEIRLNSLYVGNLRTDVTSDDLKALSTDIESVCLPKKFTDSHSLYAFITFASKENAYSNYKALQGKKLKGRVLKIEFARNAQNNFKGKQEQHKRKFEHQEYDPAKKGKFTEKE